MADLNTSVIQGAPGATRTAYVLHGILGSGRNWRSFGRRIVQRWPGWRLVLVDLRGHGDSPSGDPPHTIAACVDDLEALRAAHGAPDRIVGHSFGGKVALAWAERAWRADPSTPGQAWALDSPPGPLTVPADAHEVSLVIAALRAIPLPLASRAALVEILTARGFSQGIAGWMTTNLKRGPDGLVWRFDLDAIAALIDDYFRRDIWPLLASAPPGRVHLVRAGRSDRWSPAALGRIAGLSATLHTLPDAGHWVHVDDPDGLLALLEPAFVQ